MERDIETIATDRGEMIIDWNVDYKKYVAQSNDMIESRQSLNLNAAKIMRAVIMQIKPDDDDFKLYVVPIPVLSEMLKVSPNNLYRDVDKLTDEILNTIVSIKDPHFNTFLKFPIAELICYDKRKGLAVKISGRLKPYLLNLKERYTQYQLVDVLTMKSAYAIRIYELLMKEKGKRGNKLMPKNGIDIVMNIDDIKLACGCIDTDGKVMKFERVSQFKEKVLDVAVHEINRTTSYKVSYTDVKEKGRVTKVKWHLSMVEGAENSTQVKKPETKTKERPKSSKTYKPASGGKTSGRYSRFNDFEQQDYDFDELERRALQQ